MRGALLALVCAACGSASEPAAAPRSRPPPVRRGEAQVRLTLLADITRVAPGQELTLGARFDIAPGWHLYWSNPGDTGLATEAAFAAPAGFAVGPVRYPGPVRFDSPGDITSYGYRDLAMLSAPVSGPDSMAGDRVRFSVQASWLACREICVPGRGEASIELEVAGADRPSQPAHRELFASHREVLPRPLAELGAAAPAWRRDDRQAGAVFEVRGAERLEYFPSAGEDLALVGQASIPSSGGQRLELAYRPSTRPLRLGGVLAVTRAGSVRYYAVSLEEPSR